MFIGEAPGKNEAKTGRPFCGAAGKILDELLHSIELDRKEVYITNIVKDRPPENRDPLPEEIAVYGPFLQKQIDLIQPKTIVTLGRYSMQYVFDVFGLGVLGTISELHGKSFPVDASYGAIRIVVLYHPAAAIYNQSLKTVLRQDFQLLRPS
jgi:DNA polymerase